MKWIDFTEEFPPVSAKQWKQQVQYELAGDDYTSTLVWESPEGIKVKPLYGPEDLEGIPPVGLKTPNSWKIAESILVSDVSQANEEARMALEAGADALEFKLKDNFTEADKLFSGIDPGKTEIHFRTDSLDHAAFGRLFRSLPESGKAIFLHRDPLGYLARTGNWISDEKIDLQSLSEILTGNTHRSGVQLLGIDCGLYQNAGANLVQQLAYSIAHACEYCHFLGSALQGQAPAFTVAIGPQYFFEIAKLRALRQLWAIVAAEFGLTAECHILAKPSSRNMTLYDYNTNMLRTASACMSAIQGNANTVVNLSYDHLFKYPNEFGARLARNQLLILKHESHFNSLGHVAKGAYFIESISSQLAEKALGLFKQLEAGGGFLNQLKKHTIQKKIRENAAREEREFEQKQLILVGTNAFINEEDPLKEQLDFNPFQASQPRKTLIEPVMERRLSAKMEEKRLKNE